jgi:hypothetical protein
MIGKRKKHTKMNKKKGIPAKFWSKVDQGHLLFIAPKKKRRKINFHVF